VVQPIADVSPPKWHLGHTTWFFEQFILVPHLDNYAVFDKQFSFVFNSYYEAAGQRILRTNRGNLSRPTVDKIYAYRAHVNQAMQALCSDELHEELLELIIIGCHHEEQHQELLLTDIKYIFGHNPLFPEYSRIEHADPSVDEMRFLEVPEGMYEIGHQEDGFCYDNELGVHKVFIGACQMANRLITNQEYLAFIEDGGYAQYQHWHAEGWQWVKDHEIKAPMYWHRIDGGWYYYNLTGLHKVNPLEPVAHVSYFEAAAFAAWKGCRLPTEFEWETAARMHDLQWGSRWEWTESAYLPYPNYQKAPGALGEYNGKFMVNQKVLKGASVATAPDHSRVSYRNFFPTDARWQFTGIRLVQNG